MSETKTAPALIQTRGLTKTYQRFEKEAGLAGSFKSLFRRKYLMKTAVEAFDLDIGEGEFVGLIGPNGAGKTSLVKMLTGIVAPTSGSIAVLGFYPNKLEDAFKKQYALVMGQKSQLFFDLTAADTFLLFKELYQIPAGVYRRNLDYFTGIFKVQEQLNVQVRTLSLGERMKLELITALLHNPRLLFLDEPTIGLDAPAQRQIRSFLREVNRERGTTIILTSHYMEDVRSLCPRSVVINGGRKLYDGSTEKLFASYQSLKKISLRFDEDMELSLPAGAVLTEQGPGRLVFTVAKERSGGVLGRLMERYSFGDIAVEEEDIGSVVERIYAAGSAAADPTADPAADPVAGARA
ncbi:MAG: ATP-binding cassette domain-containing protein [Treponema sp.]|nr:ATP-binding cassette domain-containing protein [Treponema sp.]